MCHKFYSWVLCLVLSVFCCKLSFAANLKLDLPEALSFATNLVLVDAKNVAVEFNLAVGYDVYADKIVIATDKSSDVELGMPQFPKAVIKHHLLLGDYTVYDNHVRILLPIIKFGKGNLVINLSFQGCKGLDSCYPVIKRQLSLNLNTGLVKPVNQSMAASLLSLNRVNYVTDKASYFNNPPVVTCLIFLGLGILIAFTPCVFPLFPILLSVIVGRESKQAFKLATAYVLGGSLTYALAGFCVAYLGHSIQEYLQSIWVAIISAVLFMLFGLSLLGLFEIRLPHKVIATFHHYTHNYVHKMSWFKVLFLGMMSTLVLSPCVTAPLAGALVYIANTGNIWLGTIALFMLGVGIGVPLLSISLIGNRLLPKTGGWMIHVKQFLGLLMLGMVILVLMGYLISWIIYFACGIWLLGFVWLLYLWLTPWRIYQLLLTTLVGVLSVGFILYPLVISAFYNNNSGSSGIKELSIVPSIFINQVTNLQQLDKILQQNSQQWFLLDFSAKWCLACKEMDLSTWQDKHLQQIIRNMQGGNMQLVRVDITANDVNSRAIQQKYKVFAPPTIVILDIQGNVVKNIAGNTSATELIKLLSKLK